MNLQTQTLHIFTNFLHPLQTRPKNHHILRKRDSDTQSLQENNHLAAAKNGRKALKTAGKFKKRQN
jgi:hypothetical protein